MTRSASGTLDATPTSLGWAVALSCAILAACDGPQLDVRISLRPSQSDFCRPSEVLRIDVQPLLDTPRVERPPQSLDLASGASSETLDPLPAETRGLAVSAQARGGWRGGGVALVDPSRLEVLLPMLPFRSWCELTDFEIVLRPGAAIAATDDGRMVIAGGDTDDFVSDAVILVTPGEPLAEVRALRLSRERTRASATWTTDARVVVAGGTVADATGIRDTFDVLDLDALRVESFNLGAARYDHAAARLPDGSVLLASGVGEGGHLRTDAELVVVDEDGASASSAGSAVPRAGATALPLDDGSVVIVGGTDADGEPSGAIERWDGTSLVALPPWDAPVGASYAALTGARVAMVGGSDGAGRLLARITVLMPDGDRVEVDAPGVALESLRALGLEDGRLLVSGLDTAGPRRATVRIDLGGTRAEPSDAIRGARSLAIPGALVPLGDGSIVAADANGVDVMRLDLATSYDDPPAEIDPGQTLDREHLSLDVASRWTEDPPPGAPRGPLYATADDARLELAGARFSHLRLSVEPVGPMEVLLTRPDAPAYVIAIDTDGVTFGGCAIERGAQDAEVVIERRRASLTISAADHSATCELDEENARVGVALRLPRGSGVLTLGAVR
ncbi:MAG: hypothetical protein AB7S26_33940 [Sandaracinaceae bacterium]